jgi:hypothetical protein
MKRLLIFLFCSALLLTMSCKKYLDVVPDEYVTDEDVFNNINLGEQALARLYNALPDEIDNDITAYTDESYHHWSDNGGAIESYKFNLGTWSTTDNPLGKYFYRAD